MADQLTVVADGTFINPGLVRVGDLPNLDADVTALEVKTAALQAYYDTKLAQKTSWAWADVSGVPYAQTPNPGIQWGFQPVAGLLKYGEVTGALVDGDHLVAATPAGMLAIQNYFLGALSASRKVNGYDLRHDVFVTAEDLGSYSTDVILAKAGGRHGPTDLAGDDYRLVKTTVTYNPTTTDAPGAMGTITAITPTSITMTYYKFAVLRKGIWSVVA